MSMSDPYENMDATERYILNQGDEDEPLSETQHQALKCHRELKRLYNQYMRVWESTMLDIAHRSRKSLDLVQEALSKTKSQKRISPERAGLEWGSGS